MGMLKQHFPKVPVVALTATADKLTRKDIVDQLKLEEPEIFIASFDRPNLSLEVRPGQQRLQQIEDFVRKHPKQAGIIYTLSRKATEDIADKLKQKGFKAEAYHAGLSPDRRSKIHALQALRPQLHALHPRSGQRHIFHTIPAFRSEELRHHPSNTHFPQRQKSDP